MKYSPSTAFISNLYNRMHYFYKYTLKRKSVPLVVCRWGSFLKPPNQFPAPPSCLALDWPRPEWQETAAPKRNTVVRGIVVSPFVARRLSWFGIEMATKKPVCKYGAKCYRRNPQHRKDFIHPDADISDDSTDESEVSLSGTGTVALFTLKYQIKAHLSEMCNTSTYWQIGKN